VDMPNPAHQPATSDDGHDFPELMERVRTSSAGAAKELVDRYGAHILRVIRWRMHRKLRSKFDSQDFVQSVWASFFALPLKQYQFGQPEELAHFLTGLAQNKMVDAVRQRVWGVRYAVHREEVSLNASHAPAEISELPAPAPTPEEIAIAKEEWQKVLADQPTHHQAILTAVANGKSLRELAAEIGVTERTIRRVLRHAVARREQP
jgi:RNA polymerase sigma factor (sigma-70 family)